MQPSLAAIAEPRREQILKLVWLQERTAGDIAGHMPVTFGAVSQHLKVLLAAGLVAVRRDGKKRWYIANRDALGALAPALEQMWFGKLGELKRLAEAAQASIDAAAPATAHAHPPRQHPPSLRNTPRRGRDHP